MSNNTNNKVLKYMAFIGLILSGFAITIFIHQFIFEDFSWMDLFYPFMAALLIYRGYEVFLKSA